MLMKWKCWGGYQLLEDFTVEYRLRTKDKMVVIGFRSTGYQLRSTMLQQNISFKQRTSWSTIV